jgi:hypothetical protein
LTRPYFYFFRCRNPKEDLVTIASIPFFSVRAGLQQGRDQWWSSLAFDFVAAMANVTPFEHVTPHDYFWGENSPFLEWIDKHIEVRTQVND